MSPVASTVERLHNMSMRPSTPVEATVRGVGGRTVVFALDRLPDDPLWAGGTTNVQRADAVARRATELTARLDGAWSALGLRGAVLLWASPEESTADVLDAVDPLLAINVLARAQGEILIAGAPALLERSKLRRALATDDPRIVAAVLAGRAQGDPS